MINLDKSYVLFVILGAALRSELKFNVWIFTETSHFDSFARLGKIY